MRYSAAALSANQALFGSDRTCHEKTKSDAASRGLTRRDFIAGATGAAGSLALAGCGDSAPSAAAGAAAGAAGLPAPKDAGFDHVVVVMMENRSFDHFLGWVPGADGVQVGTTLKDSVGTRYASYNLAPKFQNCELADPDHSYAGGRTEINEGRMAAIPTVWDRMQEVGRSVAYYYTDVSYTSFWGDKYKGFSKKFNLQSFAADIAGGTLASLTFVDNIGNTLNEGGAISMDDHPYADVRDGQAFLNHVYDALRKSPQWDRTLVIINYDEWGGFYDHVTPPLAPVTPEEFAATGNDGRLGCRVPCILMGPRAKRGHVEHMQFDPNSILNMLAWRFGFAPLGARASSNNIALALDYNNPPNASTPSFDVAQGPFGGGCIPTVLIAHQLPVAVPVPPLPIAPIPLPVPVQLPSVPGHDVPLPGLPSPPAGPSTAGLLESALRREDHEQELQALRDLGGRFGF